MQATWLTPPAPPKLVATLWPVVKRLRAAAGSFDTASDAANGLDQGILLHGDSSERRRAIARFFTHECGVHLVETCVAKVLGASVEQTAMLVRELFLKARALAPAILLVNDLDTFAPRKGSPHYQNGHSDRIAQFLHERGSLPSPHGFIFNVATAEHLEEIEPAITAYYIPVDVSQ